MHTIVEADRRCVQDSLTVVSRVTGADLDRPTPCAGWTLADLLGHMTAQHHGFAAAATGMGGDLAAWRVRPLGDDPAATYAEAAESVLAAFAREGAVEREFSLPEVSTKVTIPGVIAVGFHFIDYIVHAWDVARSLGLAFEVPDDLVQLALPIAQAVPDGANRRVPGASFKPGLSTSENLVGLDRILALLGRSPAWPD